MTDQTPLDPGSRSDRSMLGDITFFVVVCLIIVGFALLGIAGDRTASNPPVQTGQNMSVPPVAPIK